MAKGPLYEGLVLLLLHWPGGRPALGAAGERLVIGCFAGALERLAPTSFERALVSLHGRSAGLKSNFGRSGVLGLALLPFVVLGVRNTGDQ